MNLPKISPGKKNLSLYYGRRSPKRRMPIADIVFLNLVRIFDRTGDLKTYHKNAREHYIQTFLLQYFSLSVSSYQIRSEVVLTV